jgi:hypothetical protein
MKNIDRIKIDKQKMLLASIIIFIGVLCRIILHDFFNSISNPWAEFGFLDVFFIIAAVSIFSAILLGKIYTIAIPLIVLVITDVFYALVDPVNTSLYTTWLFLFTGSGYIFIALLSLYISKKSKLNIFFIPKILGVGILGIIIYDLWTNFGFWLSYSRLGWYPITLEGLATVYIGGLPFMIWHILSTSIVITVILIPIIYLTKNKLIKSEPKLNPIEKYVITSTTLFLMIVSIISAII